MAGPDGSEPRKDSGPPEEVQDAAVIGVVIAGVLVSFTIPGPFDWGSMLIGVILLAVLYAYGSWPQPLTKQNLRRAVGMAAAGAFCLVQVLGRPLDSFVVDSRRLLSRWPEDSVPRDEDAPDPNAGIELLVLWVGLFALLMAVWLVVEWRRRSRQPVPAPPPRR